MNSHRPSRSLGRNVSRILIASAGVLSAQLVRAELPPWAPGPKPYMVEDRFRVEVNFMWAAVDTKIRIDPALNQPGTLIDTEKDLGMDAIEFLPQVELTMLPGENHLLRLNALTTRRSSQTTINRQITFDDQVYQVGELVDSELNLTLFGLTYGYRFVANEKAELAATLGVQIASVDANAVVRSRVVRDSEDGVAPIPLVGLEGRYEFKKNFAAEARAQYLGANIEDVDGSILDARVAATYRLNPYLVFGLGYRLFEIDIDSQNDSAPGLVDLSVAGPLLFVRASM